MRKSTESIDAQKGEEDEEEEEEEEEEEDEEEEQLWFVRLRKWCTAGGVDELVVD